MCLKQPPCDSGKASSRVPRLGQTGNVQLHLQSITGDSGSSVTPGQLREAGVTHCHGKSQRGKRNSEQPTWKFINTVLPVPSFLSRKCLYICTRVYFIHECTKTIYTHNISIYAHCTLMHNRALHQLEITARKRKNSHKTPLSTRSPSDLGYLDK